MALQFAFESPTGATYDSAYARVVQISLDLRTPDASLLVHFHVNAAARISELAPIYTKTYSLLNEDGEFDQYFRDNMLQPAGDSPLAQAYGYLKTLSDFEGAIDV